MNNHKNIFTSLYEKRAWGNDNHPEYKGSSGTGSTKELANGYLIFLKNFVETNNIKSIIDLGCGTFKYNKIIYKNVKNLAYTGYDVYEDLITSLNKEYANTQYSFINLDIYNEMDKIIDGELFIIKDVLQHWSNEEIIKFLRFIINNKKFKYLLITNSCHIPNSMIIKDIQTGYFRPLSINSHPLNKFNLTGLFKFGSTSLSNITGTDIWIKNILETSILIKNYE
jgi:SAM-dependent methyltransferase